LAWFLVAANHRNRKKMILVTGAGGFVGTAVVSELARRGISYRAVTRRPREGYLAIGNIDPATDWAIALDGVETVVHLASRAHVLNEKAFNAKLVNGTTAGSPPPFQFADVDATLNLARQAAAAGVKRFVFISSIKVNGEATRPGRPFTAEDAPNPQNPYAQSKFDAERKLFALAAETGLEVTVIRPPLVYGPGVKANFATMMDWVNRGIPLPLGAVNNKRSFVFVDNPADLIILTAIHPGAGGQVFLVSDDEDISTTELLQRMAQALGRTSRNMPVPAPVLTLAAAALGRRAFTSRLTDSLQVDIGKTRELLGWAPRKSVAEGLRQTARSFQSADLALDPIARSA
jgi:nucleoside-diphosphate-sugar epimerase